MKLPTIKIRRLKIFGTAMLALGDRRRRSASSSTSRRRSSHRSARSATSSPSTTRCSRFAARPGSPKLLHLPDNDPPNDNIRLVTIDEATLQDPPAGLGRPDPAHLHRRPAADAGEGRSEGGRPSTSSSSSTRAIRRRTRRSRTVCATGRRARNDASTSRRAASCRSKSRRRTSWRWCTSVRRRSTIPAGGSSASRT